MEESTLLQYKLAPKSRGSLLAILLVLILVTNIIGLTQLPNTIKAVQLFYWIPKWYPVWYIAEQLLGIVILINLWYWKRIAVYIYFVNLVVGCVVTITALRLSQFIASAPLSLLAIGAIGLLLPQLLFLWAIKRKWQFFT